MIATILEQPGISPTVGFRLPLAELFAEATTDVPGAMS
jgi:hypothetical protein